MGKKLDPKVSPQHLEQNIGHTTVGLHLAECGKLRARPGFMSEATLTVFILVDDVFGFQTGVDGARRQVLRAARLDLHVLVGLQVKLEYVKHVTGVEHVPGGFAKIAKRRWSHLDWCALTLSL